MSKSIKYYWKKYSFEIILIGSILLILILSLTRIGKKGKWDELFKIINKSGKRKLLNNNLDSSSSFQDKHITDSKGEIKCRQILENIFKKPFSKNRPDFLRNKVTGNIHNLELDCYNPQLKIALEYNGIQHYKHTPYFHKNKEAFYNQCYRDDMKRRLCKENDILLIEVPYTVKYDDLEDYILKSLK